MEEILPLRGVGERWRKSEAQPPGPQLREEEHEPQESRCGREVKELSVRRSFLLLCPPLGSCGLAWPFIWPQLPLFLVSTHLACIPPPLLTFFFSYSSSPFLHSSYYFTGNGIYVHHCIYAQQLSNFASWFQNSNELHTLFMYSLCSSVAVSFSLFSPTASTPRSSRLHKVRGDAACYIFMLADYVLSLKFVISMHWVSTGGIHEWPLYCW